MAIKFKDSKTPPALLSGEQRRFIIRALAKWNSPSEVARMVLDEFGITITRQLAQTYDPTRAAGVKLAPELKKYFREQREYFVKHLEEQPFAHRSIRLDELKKIYDEARDAGDRKSAIKALDSAGKEMKIMDYAPDADDDETNQGDE
jgi:hypothetical protein